MRITINLQIFLFIIIFMLTKQIEIYAYLMIFAFIHELGHLFTGLVLGLKPETLKIMPFGLSIIFKTFRQEPKIYLKKFLIAAAGPVVNIIIAIAGIILKWRTNIIYANSLITIFNLLPIYPLDGGRILKSILSFSYQQNECQEIVLKVSNITIVILTAFSSILVLILKNIGLLFVIMYLWGLLIKENKKLKLKRRIYNIIKNTKENIDN